MARGIRSYPLGALGRARIHPLAGLSLVLGLLVGGVAVWMLIAAPDTNRRLAGLASAEIPIEKLPAGAAAKETQGERILPATPGAATPSSGQVTPMAALQPPLMPNLGAPKLGPGAGTAAQQAAATPGTSAGTEPAPAAQGGTQVAAAPQLTLPPSQVATPGNDPAKAAAPAATPAAPPATPPAATPGAPAPGSPAAALAALKSGIPEAKAPGTPPPAQPAAPSPGQIVAAGVDPTPPAPTFEPGPPPVAGGLAAAPVAELTEQTQTGPLPKIAPDGRQPWRVYGRPYDSGDKRPRIAIIVSGLGMSSEATNNALKLRPEVTLAFAPFADKLKLWVDEARGGGHEVLLTVPMEPDSYPKNDPGPATLLTSLTEDSNSLRLTGMLTRASGYVGMINTQGSKFLAEPATLRPVLAQLRQRGLLFVESKTAAASAVPTIARELALPYAQVDKVLDQQPSKVAIDKALAELEATAKRKGFAIGMAGTYPVTIERLNAWLPTLQAKGIAIVPVTAVGAPANTLAAN